MKKKLKILHLESCSSDAKMIASEIRKAGIEADIMIAANRQDFLSALNEFWPHLILSDHKVPSLQPGEALKIVKTAGRSIPFIVITSSVSEEFAAGIIKSGANDYILKDNLKRLPSAIEEVMEVFENCRTRLQAEEELRSAHHSLLFHLENSPLAYIEWDNEFNPKVWSRKAEDIFGWSMAEFEENKMTGLDLIATDGQQQKVNRIAERLRIGAIEKNKIENRNRTKDGRIIFCEWFNSTVKNEDGKVITIMSLVQDITERKKSEDTLAKNELRFREFFETAPEALFVLNPANCSFVDYNYNALRLLNCTAETMLGKSPADFSPEFQPDGTYSLDRIVAMCNKALNGMQPEFDFVMCNNNGKEIHCELRLNLLTRSERPLIRVSVLDITERVNLEKMLVEEEVKKQVEITDAVINAQEKERAFLGEEMHDNINQLLATSKLYLDFSVSTQDIRKDMITAGRNYILDAMEEIRKLSKTLIAPSLGEISLEEAVNDMIGNIKAVNNLEFVKEWKNIDEKILSEKFRLGIFRIIQEQLGNILKHAEAKKVCIKLMQMKSILQLVIKDDGIGFDTTAKRTGVGHKNIISRATLFKGNVFIKSRPGKGSELKINFDMEATAK